MGKKNYAVYTVLLLYKARWNNRSAVDKTTTNDRMISYLQ